MRLLVSEASRRINFLNIFHSFLSTKYNCETNFLFFLNYLLPYYLTSLLWGILFRAKAGVLVDFSAKVECEPWFTGNHGNWFLTWWWALFLVYILFVKNMRIPELNELNLSVLKDKYFSSKILIFGSFNFDPQAIFIWFTKFKIFPWNSEP